MSQAISTYLEPNDYLLYGLPETTTTIQVQQASLMIDGFLNRPEGLIYATDFQNQPCWMAAKSPDSTMTAPGGISAGKNVVATLSPPITLSNDTIGQVVILDRANGQLAEAVVISAVASGGQVTFYNVANNHAANCTVDFGMTIFEERYLPAERSIARVSRPLVKLMAGQGRYEYGRRTDQNAGLYTEINLLAIIQAFGGPPMWEPFNPTLASVTPNAREIWIPAGELLQYYSMVRLYYVSGWTYQSLPPAIKQACANLINAVAQNAILQGQLKAVKSGTTAFTRLTASNFDDDTKRLLEPFRCFQMI